jgi:hypothetical protein
LAAIVGAVVFALAVAGCGGGGSDSGSGDETSAPLSKAAFVKSADAICAEGQKEVEAGFTDYLSKNGMKKLGEPGESNVELKEHAIALMETVGIPALNQQIDELKALEAPSDLKAKAAEFTTYAEEGVEEGEGNPYLLYTSVDKLLAKSDKIANELGFQVCGGQG